MLAIEKSCSTHKVVIELLTEDDLDGLALVDYIMNFAMYLIPNTSTSLANRLYHITIDTYSNYTYEGFLSDHALFFQKMCEMSRRNH